MPHDQASQGATCSRFASRATAHSFHLYVARREGPPGDSAATGPRSSPRPPAQPPSGPTAASTTRSPARPASRPSGGCSERPRPAGRGRMGRDFLRDERDGSGQLVGAQKAEAMPSPTSPERRAGPTGRGRRAHEELEALGPLPLRAPMGHRARGLLGGRRELAATSPTSTRAAAPTAGARTGCWASPTASAACASPSRSGTAATPSSRSGSSGSRTPRATTARTSRSAISTWIRRPTHSWMSALYKYPQAAFPYERLRAEAARGRATTRVRAVRHRHLRRRPLLRRDRRVRQGGPGRHLHPHHRRQPRARSGRRCTSCRRSGFATPGPGGAGTRAAASSRGCAPFPPGRVQCDHDTLGRMCLDVEAGAGGAAAAALHRERDQLGRCLFGAENASPYVKDAFDDYVVGGRKAAVNPQQKGTKCSAHFVLDLAPGEERVVRLRLRAGGSRAGRALRRRRSSRRSPRGGARPTSSTRRCPGPSDPEARLIARQAYAGLLWSKQFYHYVVEDWLEGDPTSPRPRQSGSPGATATGPTSTRAT